MNKLYFVALFCLLASVAIGVESFAGKTSPRRSKTSPRKVQSATKSLPVTVQEQDSDSDSSNDVKGFERPADESGSLSRGIRPPTARSPSRGPVKDTSDSSSDSAAESDHPAPEPYSFAFTSNTDDGASSTREESQDKNGRITGFYTLNNADGTQRRVNYVADATGFHATIQTNEENAPPADASAPADVEYKA